MFALYHKWIGRHGSRRDDGPIAWRGRWWLSPLTCFSGGNAASRHDAMGSFYASTDHRTQDPPSPALKWDRFTWLLISEGWGGSSDFCEKVRLNWAFKWNICKRLQVMSWYMFSGWCVHWEHVFALGLLYKLCVCVSDKPRWYFTLCWLHNCLSWNEYCIVLHSRLFLLILILMYKNK